MPDRTTIMGVLNVTPDSFSDGGCYNTIQKATDQARQMRRDGANIIDIGGESTRPGADSVSLQQELDRVLPVVEALKKEDPNFPLSIDTTKSEVARAALACGPCVINDVSSGECDANMFAVVAQYEADLILMHKKGSPKTMQDDPTYNDVCGDVKNYFEDRIRRALQAGITKDAITLDPGIGFGKNLNHNLNLKLLMKKH